MTTEVQQPQSRVSTGTSADTMLGFAMLGLLAAGFIGIWKAMGMSTGFDVLLCLLGAVAAFGAVYYIYFDRR